MYRRLLLPDEIMLMSEPLKEVMDLYNKAGFEIYLVGGGVRSLIVGNRPENCDLTTNATPEESLELLKMKSPFYNNDFGTVSYNVQVDGAEEVYEITTYRSEKEYSDYRRPDNVSWGKTLEEDVTRRDFTINAIVVGVKNSKTQKLKESKDGGNDKREWELIDLVNGLADFEKGVIRAVGDPRLRFSEDALRMMRAIRFAARLGFTIEEKTLEAISEKAELLTKISKERIREELLRTLATNYPADGMRLFISTGLINYFMPEVLESKEVAQGGHHNLSVLDHMLESLSQCPSTDPIVRFATFIHDVGKPRSRRFKCRKCGKMFRDIAEDVTTCASCGFVQPTKGMITFYGHEVVGAKMVLEICERLRFNRKQIDKIVTLVRYHMFAYQPEMTDAAIRRLIRKIGKENINDMVMLRIGDRKGSGSRTTSWRFMELQKRIGEQLFEPMEINDMAVNGRDVMEALKVQPGPIIGKILKELFEEVLEDTGKNDREYLLGRIEELGKMKK